MCIRDSLYFAQDVKSIFPESRPLLEQYRALGLADISPEQRLILKGRGRLLVDAIAAELC